MPDDARRPSSAFLFLHAQTALHPGGGAALGVVDLPVQRERHTQWPFVAASAVKGVLRDRCRESVRGRYDGSRQKANADKELESVFGPAKVDGEGSAHAGALAVTDARLLAFPVRSLKGVFAWVTCAAVLERLSRDLQLAGFPSIKLPGQWPGDSQAFCTAGGPLVVDGDSLILEEFEFKRSGEVEAIAEWVSSRAVSDDYTRGRLKSHLAVLSDDDFNHFARHATEVVARIALDYEQKTVKTGALFYQEFLPPETLFYSLLLAQDGRREGHAMLAANVLSWLRTNIPPVIQIGGDETTGKGLCAVRIDAGR